MKPQKQIIVINIFFNYLASAIVSTNKLKMMPSTEALSLFGREQEMSGSGTARLTASNMLPNLGQET